MARVCLALHCRYWSEDPENKERFPLFVSVDGGDQATMQFAAALNWGAEVQVIHNLRDPSRCKPNQGYCNLSVHYHMLLQLFFECHKVPRLLFMEEDLEIAPDFFSYFRAMAPVLDSDKSLMCVSAWNDHGQRGRALNSSQVYRTDIFPGLGWMLTASFAKEIYQDWPNELWDEYMRRPKVRQGRQCLFPEVPRTHTFGKVGTSGGQFFDQHLAVMLLNNDKIDWTKQVRGMILAIMNVSRTSSFHCLLHNKCNTNCTHTRCSVSNHTCAAPSDILLYMTCVPAARCSLCVD